MGAADLHSSPPQSPEWGLRHVWTRRFGAACVLGFVATGFAAVVSLECDGRDDTASTRQTPDPARFGLIIDDAAAAV